VFVRALPCVRQFDAGFPLGLVLSTCIWNLQCLKQQWIMYFCSSRFPLLVAILPQLLMHNAAHQPHPTLYVRGILSDPQHLTDYRVRTFLISNVRSHFTSYIKGYERSPDTTTITRNIIKQKKTYSTVYSMEVIWKMHQNEERHT
jgi:hypothetical protein